MRIIKRTEARSNGITEERYYCPECMRVLAVRFVGARPDLPERCSVCGAELEEPKEEEE